MTDESPPLAQPYDIISVQRAKPPPGAEGSNWHRYVIAFEGTNTIRGCRQGSLTTVMTAVEEIVTQLNKRHSPHLTKPGRVNLVWPRKKETHES